ncbi:MAG TPA: AAA family ATPase, partial [Anaerolineae bacterium]|nr:AAA family ATPase [Anaerolineae bacterium]
DPTTGSEQLVINNEQLAMSNQQSSPPPALHSSAPAQDQPSNPPAFQPSSLPAYPLAQLSADTGYDEATLTRWLRALARKGQIILYGPPGTGKTFVAEKLAAHLVGGGDGLVELVQFHPAYAYEDFMQGLRPQARPDGGLDYPLLPGRFLEFCRQAVTRQSTCVLIIDEINRADLARVLGELMYLLEYRDREIPLAGGGRFRIPENVRLIGTMNTADRSIALVDHALRRRFAFIALNPNFDLLRRYHQQHDTGFEVEGLVKVLQQLNQRIADPHYELGVTFFLRPNLADEIGDIWQMEVEPYLEEYFFDRPDTVTELRWARVRPDILGEA